MRRGKVFLVGISGILVVGIVVGCVVVGVNKNHKSDGHDNNDVLSTASKSVAAICGPTDYKQACVESLGSVAHNESATPQQLVQAALQYTIEEVKRVMENSTNVKDEASKDPFNKMAAEDCQELLQYAVDELQAAFSQVGDPSLHTPQDRADEFNNWLSAVLSYQETCLDGFNSTQLRTLMSDKLLKSRQLSDNALAIFSGFSDIMKSLNIPINMNVTNPSARRLLDAEGGYPTWMSGADRKLLAARNNAMRPNAVVAKDGSGRFKTISAALAAYPKNNRGRYVIYVKAGVYDEYITVEKNQVNVFMYGDGPKLTVITGRKSNTGGFSTFKTASFSAIGNGFIAKGIGFKNTAGPEGHQAVALRVQSDMAAFYNCRMDAFQDTLYLQTHRHFIRNCVISGTVDFIFGMGSSVIQNSVIVVRLPMKGQQNTVTAHGRQSPRENTGVVIQNCKIVPAKKLVPVRFQVKTFLGRPWKEYSRAVIMESQMADFIQPEGWMPWAGNFALNTLYFAEFGNTGPGGNRGRRVHWKGYHAIRNRNEVLPFTAGAFLQGRSWIPATTVPNYLGMAR